jgi:hypothetical protein
LSFVWYYTWAFDFFLVRVALAFFGALEGMEGKYWDMDQGV